MTPLRVLIVDDEPLARRRLEILLREQPATELAGAASDGVAAARMIAERAPDVVLLDIKMPGLTGLEVLDGLGKEAPIVIFVTAFDRFALDAFDRAAFDYLLKPVEPARLAAALTRARAALANRAAAERALELEEILRNLRSDPAAVAAPSAYAREIWIQERGGRTSVPVAAIDWIAAERDYVRIHTGARSFLVRQSIGALAERLDPGQFLRIHRSSLVRTDRIVRIRHAAGRGAVMLSTGVEVAVSRRHMGALKAMSRGC
ncbi:LytTR family DNA-binding domain-containing protein [Phenylobacterium sp.]|uniref:LytR/AlgR family response regulator transcription factor n=1 Tax=Phenylobacterium sp. TaxID=1871053 RepID=UPI001214F6A7|nr:LytTR family DNA-binding domain-containing protein [Phenylobacterium sp.]THD62430.1 MAG: response regulator transcription factor [Phenylobacterium sp.]